MPVDPEKRLYTYDPIGNRQQAAEDTAVTDYTSDSLNRYTALSGAVTVNPGYDDDGNMTSYNGKTYTWNAENRLISVAPASPADGDKKLDFVYDYMGRRIQKKVCTCSSGS